MRLVRTLVPAADREAVVSVLDDQRVDYVVLPVADDDAEVVVEFPVPTQAVEPLFDDLRATGGFQEQYTVVTSAETAVTEHVDELEERFVTGTEEDDSIPTEEIRATALDMTPSRLTYYSMALLSALVATAGLLLDAPAVVVGSMVIAPLVGTALTASVGTVLADRGMMVDGFAKQLLGLVLAVAGAAAFSTGLTAVEFLPPALDVATTQQIAGRTSPGLLSLVVGVCAGAAGGFGLATDVPVSLVGVMVAAALIPAAAAVGIGLAWGLPAVALGAGFMLALNLVSIHVAGVAVLWYLDYRPEGWTRGEVRSNLSADDLAPVAALAVVIALVFAAGGATIGTHMAFERDVNEVTADVLATDRYDRLELVSLHVAFDGRPLLAASDDLTVTVVVSRPADERYPRLAGTLGRRIAEDTGRRVTVSVEFLDTQRHEPDG